MTRLILPVSLALAIAVAAAWGAESAKGATTLRLPAKAAGLTAEILLTTGGKFVVTSKGINVKPGTYDVKQIILSMADDKKGVWTLASTADLGGLDRIIIDEEQDKVIDVGPPILFRLRAYRPGADTPVDITCDIVGRTHEKYFAGAAPAGRKAENLPYQVLDEDGKTILAQGRMNFVNNMAGVSWMPPKDYRRKFTVKIFPEMGPFEWKYFDDYTGQSRPGST